MAWRTRSPQSRDSELFGASGFRAQLARLPQVVCGLAILEEGESLQKRILFGVAVLWVSVACFPAQAASTMPATRPTTQPVDAFFARNQIPYLRIEIGPNELEALRKDPRAYVRAKVTETQPDKEDLVFPDVAVHLKGKWGSFRHIDDRPGFTLNFSGFGQTRSFHGLWKLHLNNSVQDPSFLSEDLGRTLFRSAGVPTPRASHARVWLNGRDLGFYVLLEGLDRAFLQRSFGQRSGCVFEGALQEITDPLNVVVSEAAIATTRPAKNSPEARRLQAEAKTKALGHLKTLTAAATESDSASRRKKMEQVIDVDRFLTFMAMEALTSHWDGYCANRNNYRIYLNPTTGQFHFMPHGMDQLFQQPDSPLVYNAGLLARLLLEYPEYRLRYYERLVELRQNVVTLPAITKRLDEIASATLPVLAQINSQAAGEHRERLADLKRRAQSRIQGIDRQLASMVRPVAFDARSEATISGWALNAQQGQPAFDRASENGKAFLRIRADAGCVASLRTAVLLPKGKYAFIAQARGSGTPLNPNGVGVGLRISGATNRAGIALDDALHACRYEFEVNEPSREVVLVCEVRLQKGLAHFDEGSLKLVRR